MSQRKYNTIEEVLDSMRETAEFDQLELRSVADRGNLGNQPLHVAAAGGDAGAINCLLDHGADIDAVGEFGETALHITVQMNCLEATEILLARGASRNIRNEFGKTPLELAEEIAPSGAMAIILRAT